MVTRRCAEHSISSGRVPPSHRTGYGTGAVSDFRVFLSAVTSEFGQARDALAKDLGARNTLVRVQDSFRAEATADTLLRLLHDYVRGCSAVVCMLGTRGGTCPPRAAVTAEFRAMLPDGVSEATYTQWEFFFARHYKRRLSLCRATVDFKPERDRPSDGDRPDLQAAFLRYIDDTGLHWIGFSSRHELRAEVLKEDWPRELPAKPILLPYPSLGTLFKGRLRRLRTSLTRADGGTAAIAGRAVHGLGGVGKTRAAVEYAWAYHDDYSALALLDAETPEKLQSSLAALVGPLRLSAQAAPEEAVRVEAAIDWLNANPGWFLILDNIDSEPALAAAHRLLGRLSGGHAVLTSRLARFPRGVERLDLDVLDLDDAADFLLEATQGRRHAADDAAQARTLAEALGQLALALEMAAATIEACGLSFAGYQTLWQGNRKRVVGWARQEITGYHHAVAETWRTSVDQLTEAGRHLLERLAFLAPEPVPVSLLDGAVPGAADDEDALAARDDLATYSLATRDADGETFLVHRFVQDVTRRGLAAAGVEQQRLTEALGWVNAAFTGDAQDVRTWPVLNPLVPHAETVAGHADAAGIAEPTVDVIGRLATLFHMKALYGRAEPHFRRALAIAEASFPPADPRIAIRLNNLAQLLQDTDRFSEAEPLMRRALRIDEASCGKDLWLVAARLNNLAGLLHATNRLSEAEPLMRRAFAIDEASYGKDHPRVAIDLNNLAGLLLDTNRLGEAVQLMRRALDIDEASYGKDHPDVAIRLNNLAGLLQATNRVSEAEPLMRRALGIDEASYGKDHPNVATRLNNLALLLQATNRLGEAEPLMRRALGIDEASYGKDHPNVAIRLNNLAQLLKDTNRLGEAEPLFHRALGIYEASYGKDHPDVAIVLSNLAQLLQATDRFGEAELLMRRALAIFFAFQRDTGHAHRHRDRMTRNYASLLAAMGKSEAEIDATLAALRREVGLDQA
jgi:tetratricopeptide (TPR) repeat protein